MKKLFFPTVALLLSVIFSCNKSDISVTNTDQLKLAPAKNINVVLFDEAHATTKVDKDPTHIHLFDVSYLTDGSQALIESNLVFGVNDIRLNEVIPPGSPTFFRDTEVPWSYCMNDGTTMTGLFLDYYVTDNLLHNKPALKAFKTWFQKVTVDWMNANSLAPKPKANKLGEYWIKVVSDVI